MVPCSQNPKNLAGCRPGPSDFGLFALDGVETISCFRAVIEGSGWLGVCRRRSGRARGRAECPGAVWTWRCCRS
ncbi:hypothetical protein F7188_07755 [Helicobacter pylori]|nr:hypothetical protein [Helicobacter pylori]